MTDGVIPFEPALRRKKQGTCQHLMCEVDDDAASLTCAECDAELDPWWFLRRQAIEAEERQAKFENEKKSVDDWFATMRALAEKLALEVAELQILKNELSNERVGESTLGTIRSRRRKRNA